MILCGTGHRPDKLGGYSDEVYDDLVSLARAYLQDNAAVTHVISGGALGWDQALADAALSLSMPLTLALPFPGFEARWPDSSKKKLYALMARANRVVFVKEEPYAAWKMQARNEWMVDNSDMVLALWNGTAGGTANCVAYAKKKNKHITNLWDVYRA